jgi:hypothetical protein
LSVGCCAVAHVSPFSPDDASAPPKENFAGVGLARPERRERDAEVIWVPAPWSGTRSRGGKEGYQAWTGPVLPAIARPSTPAATRGRRSGDARARRNPSGSGSGRVERRAIPAQVAEAERLVARAAGCSWSRTRRAPRAIRARSRATAPAMQSAPSFFVPLPRYRHGCMQRLKRRGSDAARVAADGADAPALYGVGVGRSGRTRWAQQPGICPDRRSGTRGRPRRT